MIDPEASTSIISSEVPTPDKGNLFHRLIGRRFTRGSNSVGDAIGAQKDEVILTGEAKPGSVREQLDTFMHEINGAGFRWEFDHPAEDPVAFRSLYYDSSVFAQHRKNPDVLKTRLERFGRYVDAMEGYVGHGITEQGSSSLGDKLPPLQIPPELIPVYRDFQRKLVTYAQGIENHASPDVLANTAMEVCRAVRPPEKPGEKPEKDVSIPIIDDPTPRSYLEVMLEQGKK